MISATAQVVSLTSDGRARVRVNRETACARCAAGKGCGAGLLGRQRDAGELTLDVPGNLRLQPNDAVELGIADGDLLRASLLVYGLPLVTAMLAAAAAHLANATDAATVVAGLAGLLAGLAVARLRLRQVSCLKNLTPKIVALSELQRHR